MKLSILSQSPGCYSTRRLCEAAARRGHAIEVLDTLRFSIELRGNRPRLYYRSGDFLRPDAVIPRIAASITYCGTAVVRQCEQLDVFCVNSSIGIASWSPAAPRRACASRRSRSMTGSTSSE